MKVVRKAEEIYSRMKAMYLHPQVIPTPVPRRSKTTPTMVDYINKVCTNILGSQLFAMERLFTIKGYRDLQFVIQFGGYLFIVAASQSKLCP